MERVVAAIGRAHGLRGEVALDLRTDRPEVRLVAGAVFSTDPVSAGPLTLTRARHDSRGWFAAFDELSDRSAAEAVRGVLLVLETEPDEEADAWYDSDLVGLSAQLLDGTQAGTVDGVERLGAQDALRIRQADGSLALVPFVRELVPEVDIPAGRIVLDPPGGLLAVRPVDADDMVDAARDADAAGTDAAPADAEAVATQEAADAERAASA